MSTRKRRPGELEPVGNGLEAERLVMRLEELYLEGVDAGLGRSEQSEALLRLLAYAIQSRPYYEQGHGR